MVNLTNPVPARATVGPVLSGWRIPAVRMRRNQKPAATRAEAERSATILSPAEVSHALTETWGWS